MDCIFCKIINNEIPSYTIYEDDIVKAILDVNPVSDGHVLILPKKHIVDVNDLNSDLLVHINEVIKNIYVLLKDKLNIEGLTIVQNNGYGQAIKHYHVHLIPRYDNDGIDFVSVKKNSIEDIFNILK